MVAHAGDLPPRDRRLRGQQVIGERFDCLPSLQQADAGRVEDQPVGQVDAGAEDGFQVGFEAAQPEQAQPGRDRASR
jgi:hypothetical protein